MFRRIQVVSLLKAVAAPAPQLNAQVNLDVDGEQVQIHSFASQGFSRRIGTTT
jgi:hypothetical protein